MSESVRSVTVLDPSTPRKARYYKMAGPTVCEARWKEVLASFGSQDQGLIAVHPDAKEGSDLVRTILVTIGQLVQTSPRVNGNGAGDGKSLFTAMLHIKRSRREILLKEMRNSKSRDNASRFHQANRPKDPRKPL